MAASEAPTVSGTRHQPKNDNLFQTNGFRFTIHKIPNVIWFLQTANIPQVAVTEAQFPTPFIDIPIPGEKGVYGPFTCTFKTDEDFSTWTELMAWMKAYSFPESYEQYSVQSGVNGFSFGEKMGDVSDGTLILLTNKLNPNFEITFHHMFPTSLSDIEVSVVGDTVEYSTVTAEFQYQGYTYRKL